MVFMAKNFLNSMMKMNQKLGGKITRAILRHLTGVSLKPGLSKPTNIGQSLMICVWLTSMQISRQPQLTLLKLTTLLKNINLTWLPMCTRSHIGSEKIQNS